MNARFTFNKPQLDIVLITNESTLKGAVGNHTFLNTFKSASVSTTTTTDNTNTSTNETTIEAPPPKVKKSLIFKYELPPHEVEAATATLKNTCEKYRN
jgi:hypothetical protein